MHTLNVKEAVKTARAAQESTPDTPEHKSFYDPAFYDPITKLPNGALFIDRLTHALKRAERPGSLGFSVMIVEFNGFTALKRRLEQTTEDELLNAIATCLSDCLRPGDTVARLDADSFAVLLENMSTAPQLAQVAHRLFGALSSLDPNLKASIGMVSSQPDAPVGSVAADMTAQTLLCDANTAAQRAKAQGKGRYTLFNSATD